MLFSTKHVFVLATALVLPFVPFIHAQIDTAQTGTTKASTTTVTTSAPAPATATADPCLIGCVQTAAVSAGCVDANDLKCVCSSASFQTYVTSCLQSTCPASLLSQAQALQTKDCATAPGRISTTNGPETDTALNTSRNLAPVGGATSKASSTVHLATPATPSPVSAAVSNATSRSTAASNFEVGMGVVLSIALGFAGGAFGVLLV